MFVFAHCVLMNGWQLKCDRPKCDANNILLLFSVLRMDFSRAIALRVRFDVSYQLHCEYPFCVQYNTLYHALRARCTCTHCARHVFPICDNEIGSERIFFSFFHFVAFFTTFHAQHNSRAIGTRKVLCLRPLACSAVVRLPFGYTYLCIDR